METKKLIVLIACVAFGVLGYPENYLSLSKSQRGGRIVGAKEFEIFEAQMVKIVFIMSRIFFKV